VVVVGDQLGPCGDGTGLHFRSAADAHKRPRGDWMASEAVPLRCSSGRCARAECALRLYCFYVVRSCLTSHIDNLDSTIWMLNVPSSQEETLLWSCASLSGPMTPIELPNARCAVVSCRSSDVPKRTSTPGKGPWL
jgi:hypothetical protein